MSPDQRRSRRIARWKLVKRLMLSLFLGGAITFLPLILQAVFLDPDSPNLSTMRFVATFLYWPSSFLRWGGLDCPNADSIADKLTCAGIALTVDIFIYSALCFALLTRINERRRMTGA